MTSRQVAKTVNSVADSIVANISSPALSSKRRPSQSTTNAKTKKKYVNPYLKKRSSQNNTQNESEGNTINHSDLFSDHDKMDFSNIGNIDINNMDISNMNLDHIDLDNLDNLNLGDLSNLNLDLNNNQNNNNNNNNNNVNNFDDALTSMWDHPDVINHLQTIEKQNSLQKQQSQNSISNINPDNASSAPIPQNGDAPIPSSKAPASAPAPVPSGAAPLPNANGGAPMAPIPVSAPVSAAAPVPNANGGAPIAPIPSQSQAPAPAPAPNVAESAQSAAKVSQFSGLQESEISKTTDEHAQQLQEKRLVSTFNGLQSIDKMTPNELQEYKDEILSKKLVSGIDYEKLLQESQQRQINNINASNDLSEEDKQRIAEAKSKFASAKSTTLLISAPLGTQPSDYNLRPENYDLEADVAHDKQEELKLRQQQQEQLSKAGIVSQFSGLQSTKRKSGMTLDPHKEVLTDAAKVTSFTGLQSSTRNILTVDHEEKEALASSKAVTQSAYQEQLKKQATMKKMASKVNVDVDTVGAASQQSRNIFKQMEKQTQSMSNVTPKNKKRSSMTGKKNKRKTLIQQQSSTPMSMDVVAEDADDDDKTSEQND